MIDFADLPVRIEPMRLEDVPAVVEIERQSFSSPWSPHAYEYEIAHNELATYYVARLQSPDVGRGDAARNWLGSLFRNGPMAETPSVVGYIGFWLMAGEAHISTIAVSPKFRGRAFGELLLVAAIERAIEMRAHEATLEVRVSNTVAQDLYLKYGFVKAGRRKGYYTDNNEDALIMTTPGLSSAEYQQRFQRLRQALLMRLRGPEQRRNRTRIKGGTTYGGK